MIFTFAEIGFNKILVDMSASKKKTTLHTQSNPFVQFVIKGKDVENLGGDAYG